MDQKTAIYNSLIKHLTRPDTMSEHVDLLVTMTNAAVFEDTDTHDRREAIRQVFQEFVQLCADMWGCSLQEAMNRCGEEFHEGRLLPDGRDKLKSIPYSEYLRTAHWKGVREYALLRAGYRCQLCNSAGPLEVHHRTYQGKGSEDYRDVVALCRACHSKFHNET